MLELTDIQNMFYSVYNKATPIKMFESWLYENNQIESILGNELYFNLLNINYRDKYAIIEVEKLILSHIDFGISESLRITNLLKNIVDEKGDIYSIMSQMYDDYCSGYYFLRYLGFSFITSGIEEKIGIDGIRKNLLNSMNKFKNEANRLLGFFKKGELIITDKFKFEDLRKEKDRIELNHIEKMMT